MILRCKTFSHTIEWTHRYGNSCKEVIRAETHFNEWCKDRDNIMVFSVNTNIDKEGYSIITIYYWGDKND